MRCYLTSTYLTLQSVDAVKQALDPRVIWIMHTFVSYITKLHGFIMKGQIYTNEYMLSLKSWIKRPTSSNVGRDTLGVLHQRLEWYSKYGSPCLALARKMVTTCVRLTSQCMERYSENLQVNSSFIN